jgi:uncharacterized membrane protein
MAKTNKKTSTALIILAATLFNVVVTLAVFALMMLFYQKVFSAMLPEQRQWAFPVFFIIAIAVSFAVYFFALKIILKKLSPDKFFPRLFGGKKK